MNKFIPPVILTLILAGVLLLGLDGVLNAGLLPAAASADAGMIDALFELEFQIIAIVFAFCMAFLFYSLWRFRRKPGEEGDGEHFEENTPLEVTWTLAPLALVLLLAFFTAGQHNDMIQAEPNEKPITVIASQWAWAFIYTDGATTQNELWLLVDQPVVMNISAPPSNVIHSFYIPEFRLKQDAVPGMTTYLRFTPTVVGEYNVLCAELCGSSDETIDENGDNLANTSHASMLADVCVVTQDVYDAWLANGVDLDPDAAPCTVAAGDDAETADDAGDDAETADDAGDDVETADDAGDDAETADDAGDDAETAEDAGDDAETAEDAGDDAETAEDAGDDAETAEDAGDDAETAEDAGDDAETLTGDATAGETTALMNGCTGCHANSEAMEAAIVTGPSWVGLYGSEEILDDGSVVTVNAEYLRVSIVDPNVAITEGFTGGIMPPTFADSLTEDDINNIIAYIASLSE